MTAGCDHTASAWHARIPALQHLSVSMSPLGLVLCSARLSGRLRIGDTSTGGSPWQVRLRNEWDRTRGAAGAAANILKEEVAKRLKAGAWPGSVLVADSHHVPAMRSATSPVESKALGVQRMRLCWLAGEEAGLAASGDGQEESAAPATRPLLDAFTEDLVHSYISKQALVRSSACQRLFACPERGAPLYALRLQFPCLGLAAVCHAYLSW